MAVFVALLRAVNVGGTGKLPMSELRRLCAASGCEDVTTYIQSGNVVFRSGRDASSVKRTLEDALRHRLGKPIAVHLRTPSELEAVLARNPFKEAAPQELLVLFLDRRASGEALADLKVAGRERLAASGREVFIHFPDGMGRSKLKIPFADTATGRNLNTVRKLLDLGRAAETRARQA